MSGRKGFTLIELLIVVVIIGILAAIAIPKFSNTRQKAYIAAMKSDLRNLATAQESYFSDNITYTSDLAAIGAGESQGVSIVISNVGGTGWSATGTHNATTKTCSIYFGTVTVGPADTEGEVKCTT